MLTMTESAADAVRLLSDDSGLEPEPGLRISVGPSTQDGAPLEIGLAAEPAPSDQTIEDDGARLYLEELVAPALDDMVLDAEIEGDGVRFALRDAHPGSLNGNAPGV